MCNLFNEQPYLSGILCLSLYNSCKKLGGKIDKSHLEARLNPYIPPKTDFFPTFACCCYSYHTITTKNGYTRFIWI